jgi:hypothetical protein
LHKNKQALADGSAHKHGSLLSARAEGAFALKKCQQRCMMFETPSKRSDMLSMKTYMQGIYTHLQARSHEPVDVLPRRHKHLATHVSALLGAVALVLKVNTRSPAVYHELGQTHNGCHASVTGISVGNDGTQVVHTSLELARRPLGLELLAVVELRT